MTKAKIMLCVGFLLVFAAGVSVGMLVAQARWAPAPSRRSWLEQELSLSAEQQEQMRRIWSEVMSATGEQQWQRDRDLRQERDKAVEALLTEEQKQQYDRLMEEYSRKLDELSQERKKRFDEAVEKTKQILTEEQRAKYEELLANRPGGPHRGPRGGGRPRPGLPEEKREGEASQ